MAREFRVVIFIGGDDLSSYEFRNFRAARDWANEERSEYDGEDYQFSIQQRRPPGMWEEMFALSPNDQIIITKPDDEDENDEDPPSANVTVFCVLCHSRFHTSRTSLMAGIAECPTCGANSAIEER
jgi:hypothetical protein